MKFLHLTFALVIVIAGLGIVPAPINAQDGMDDTPHGWHVHFSDVWFNVETQTATLTIINDGDAAVTLSTLTSDAAPEFGVTLLVNGVEAESLTLAAGESFDFAAEGAELVFEGTPELVLGDALPLLLGFEREGDMDDMSDGDMDDMDDMSDMSDGDMDDMDDMSDMSDGDMDDMMMDENYREYLIGVPVLAEAPPAVDVLIVDGWTRPQAPITAAYMTFLNTSDEDITLVGISSPFAGVGELHETTMVDDVMQMRPVENFVIPANGRFELMPGGFHFMLIEVNEPDRFTEGLAVPILLTFEDGTELTVAVPVLSAPFGSDGMDMGGMDMDMDHGDMEGMGDGDMDDMSEGEMGN